jgi:hypothetical protein
MADLPSNASEEQARQAMALSLDLGWWSAVIGFGLTYGGLGFAGYQVLCWLLGPQEGQAIHE